MTNNELNTFEQINHLAREKILENITLKQELEECKKIINDTLRVLPVGNINTHTPDTIPERVQYWVREAAEECSMREKWEECADKLIFYAEEIKYTVKDQALHEAIDIDIEQYEKLKEESK